MPAVCYILVALRFWVWLCGSRLSFLPARCPFHCLLCTVYYSPWTLLRWALPIWTCRYHALPLHCLSTRLRPALPHRAPAPRTCPQLPSPHTLPPTPPVAHTGIPTLPPHIHRRLRRGQFHFTTYINTYIQYFHNSPPSARPRQPFMPDVSSLPGLPSHCRTRTCSHSLHPIPLPYPHLPFLPPGLDCALPSWHFWPAWWSSSAKDLVLHSTTFCPPLHCPVIS